ncbi:MAG: class I SAM-dependent methyltransferase [Dehalococcoidia bacterium]
MHATWVAPVIALERLKRTLPKGAPVLDVGCGMGLFLALLEEAGFESIGLEVSRQSVAFLRSLGFRVAEGSVQSYATDWPMPQAITMFEVIEHLPDPVGFLKASRHRFPDAMLLLSTPSPRSWLLRLGLRLPWDYPPNHPLRWSEESLRTALLAAGYRWVEVIYPTMGGREMYDLLVGAILVTKALRNRRGYMGQEAGGHGFWLRLARRFYWPLVSLQDGVLAPVVGALLTPLAWLGNRMGASHSSFLVIAYP